MTVSAPHSLNAYSSSCSVYRGFIGTAMAPAFQLPNSPMTICGEFGSSSATRSPFWIPNWTRAAASVSLRRSNSAYEMEVPLKVYNVLNNKEWMDYLLERGLKKEHRDGYDYWQTIKIVEMRRQE